MPFEPDSSEDIFTTHATNLQAIAPDTYPQAETTLLYAILQSVSQTQATKQEDIEFVYNSAYVEDATGTELTKKARNLGVLRRGAVRATGVVTFQRDSAAQSDYTIPSGTIVETVTDTPIQYETTETVTLQSGNSAVDANVRAIDGGSDGNVASGAIQSMPSKPTGIDSVTNSSPTGDPTLTDTDGTPLVPGQDREDDEELRERVLNTDATQEGPDPAGLELAIQRTDGVISASVKTNQTNSTVNGIDPYHSEIIVYGGDVIDIANTLYETMTGSSLLRLQGGINGTKESYTFTTGLIEQDVTVPITRPTPLNFDITIDVVHNDGYVSDAAVADAIVNYIGGTRSDDTTTVGRVSGENILINEAENVVEDVNGVEYANITFIDKDGDDTDDSTTDSDGVPVVTVTDSEVARLDADNVTVNTTAR